jgi:predicted ATPase/DNA-binding SARP family transcriptional activator/predicted negative regulator of RcsB-dependent stress response
VALENPAANAQNRSMASVLSARLLGRPAFEVDGKALACPSRKAMWLAAYVLVARAKQPRAQVAALLWGADSPRHAQGSLRVALTKLPAAMAQAIEVTRDGIGAAARDFAEVDVDEFTAFCARDDEESLRRAVALYAGDLLEGAEEEVAAEFSDWLLPERARLRKAAHGAHLALAQRLMVAGDRERAREVAEKWLRHDPAAEEMHKLMMLILGGDQALAHYELYRRARAVTLGAAPSEAMAAIAERLRHGAETAEREAPLRLTAATSFFGRDDELAELRGLLADPSCRLLTLHGLGGVGKTRLASTLAQLQAGEFAGGVHVVPFEGVQSPRLFAQTLARACGLQAAGAASPLDLVASFLAERQALLVIDNLEHLLDDGNGDADSIPAQVARLLADTGPSVKVVATSREPLRLQEEWLYEVRGLPYPEGEGQEAADGQAFAAVQFFGQRARQSYVGFSLAAEMPNVVEICRLLEGLPLGLELAASWVRSVPCADIAAGLRARAKELASRHSNRAPRHGSLAAVVAYSWERLPAEQREALSDLAVLRGTFSRGAAEAVARAALRTLTALTEKALLQRAAGGRWHMHEVVRQFAWDRPDAPAKVRASRQAAALKRRDAYYVELLREMRARLDGPDEPQALTDLEAEAANVREAWRSCAQAGYLEALEAAAPAWFDLLEARSFIAEGIGAALAWVEAARAAGNALSSARALSRLGVFQRFGAQTANALASLDEALAILGPLDAPLDVAQARAARAFTLFLLGRLDDAGRDAETAIGIAARLGNDAILASGCRARGLVLVQSARREEGRDLQLRALEAALRTGKPSMRAAAQNNLALAENHLGNFRAAEAGYEGALETWRDMQMTVNVGRAMHNLGAVSTRMGDHAAALERYRAALEVLLKVGDRNLIALNLMSTGDALVRLGRPAEARAPLEQSLRMAERDGHMLPALDAHIVLGQAALALGEHRASIHHIATAIDGAREHRFANVLADALVACAKLLVETAPGEASAALAWTDEIARRAETTALVQRDAEAVLAAQAARPAGRGEPRALEAIAGEARELLARLSPSPATRSPAASSAPAPTRA